MQRILFFLILFFTFSITKSQTIQKGDIAFIGYNTGGQDGFAFIVLNDLPVGETLFLTEQGWDGNVWMANNTEVHFSYVVPSGMTRGKIISFVETAPDIITVTGGGSVTIVQGSGFSLSGGDQILAYQSSAGLPAPATPIFISGVHGDYNSSRYDAITTWNPVSINSTTWANSDCALPTGLTNGVNCISLYPAPGPEKSNAKYNGTLTGTVTQLRTAINTPSNWISDLSTTSISIQPSNYPTPSISPDAVAPSITSNPSNSTICAGSTTSFSITATDATSYKWQVNTGSGFTNITDGGVYSGATTTSLSITGATGGMNGYQYRCVATGTVSPDPTSTAATLTVNVAPTVTTAITAQSACAGGNVTFSGAFNNALTYAWQVNAGAGFTTISNNTVYSGQGTNSLTATGVTALMNGYTYRLIGSGSCTPVAVSGPVTLTVNAAPAITAEPSASTIFAGANATFSITASSATSYQWQENQGAGFANIINGGIYAGATTASLSITGVTLGMNGYVYRLVASGLCSSAISNGVALTVNAIPAVTSVTSTTSDGNYGPGQPISIQVNFSTAVTVTGTPQLQLETGTTSQTINYSSGSGGTTLNFIYTVQSGDISADLDYLSTTALTLNGGTISTGGTNAILTLPAPGAAGSLGANNALVIDAVAPTVTSVNSSLANGTYKINDLIPVTVNFSEAVIVSGTPTLSLNSGGTASYASGSGTSALIFNYTVALNESIADLDQSGSTALALAGGTIKDAARNDATLTLVAPGAVGSLGANKDIVINTTVPTVLSISRIGNATINGTSAQFLVTFSENVTGVNTSDFSITSAGISGPAVTFVSGSNATRTITVNTGTGSGTLRLDLKSSGTGIINTIGNDIQAGYTAGEVYAIDKAIPTLTAVTIGSNNADVSKAKTGDLVTLSFTASETIGTPVVNIFGNAATAITNTSANNWTATYTTQSADANGIIPFNIAFTDAAGNAGTAVTATTNSSSVTFDKTLPTLTTVTIVSNNPSNQVAKPGNNITLNFTTSESVTLPVVTIAGSTVTPTSAGGNSFTAAYTLTGAETEGVIAFNIAFTDLTRNAGTAVTATTNSSSVTVDRTAPAAPTGLAATVGNTQNTITWNASAAPDLDKYILYGGTTINPTTAIQTIPAGTLTYTHSGLTNGIGYFYRISAVDLTGNEGAKSGNIVSAPKGTQTVTFNPLAASVYGATPVTLTATSSSALVVTYTSSNTAVATVSGSTVTILAAGTTTITASQAGNSAFLAASPVTQDLVVNKKDIAVTATAKNKVYGTADPALTYTFSPALIGTDTFTGTLDRAAGEGTGLYGINQGTVTLNANYTIAFTSADLQVTAKPVTVTVAAKTKNFGESDPAFTYAVAPALIGTDAFTGTLDRAVGEQVGDYAIGQGNLSLATNYTITYVPANLSITAKTIAVNATAKTKVYGEADPALTYTFSPALNGTDVFTGNLDRATGDNIGNYAIGQGTLSAGTNYALAFNTVNLSITKKTIAIAATAGNKEYGTADPTFAYTFSPALIGTDVFTGTLGRASGENIGNYAIGQGTLVLNGNYNTTYTAADLSITKKTVTVSATAKTKVYGVIADPLLTYTFSPVLIGTDVFTGSLTRTTGENVGSYAINQGTVTAGPNYQITYVPANLNIGTKNINVTATAASKTYGAADPTLAYTFTPTLIGTDVFTGTLNRAAGENVGNYAINKNTLSLNSNYVLNYTPANLTIGKAALNIIAEDKEKFTGTANPTFSVKYTGFVNGETGAVLTTPASLSTTATTSSPIGTYNIVPSGAVATNYQISYVNGILTVKPGAPTNVLLAGTTLYENKASGTAAGILSSTSDDPAATFTYSLVSGTGDTDNALFSIGGNQLLTAASLDYENKTTYSVRLRSSTQYGFSLDKTFTINLSDVNEIPTLAAIANQAICSTTTAQNINLTGISAGPESTQSTSLSVVGNNSALLQSLTVSGSGATAIINYSIKTGASGTATITVTVKDNGGTANGGVDTYSRTFVLTVNALPVVLITADKGTSTGSNSIEVSKGETVLLNATGGAIYAWANHSSIIRGLTTSTLEVRPRETTTYTVTVTNASGCTETQTFTIKVLDDLVKIKATNIMSPNGDGKNDKWVIDNIDVYPNNEVKIFDRSGRLIYSKKGYDNSWEATLNGAPLAEGTYYYLIDFGVDRPAFKGYITVTRTEQTR